MFSNLWPGFDERDVPIGSITNGVHAPTWTARELIEMGTQTSSQGDPVEIDGPVHFDGVDKIPAADLWAIRRTLRGRLVEEVRRRIRDTALRPRGDGGGGRLDRVGIRPRRPHHRVRATGAVPQAADLMLRDPERLKALLLDPERPMQLVIAGKSHPADDGGKQLIQQMVTFADDPEIRHRIAFLPGYDIGMARYLYWGCDVWLNNPLRPLEACGTSGMKAALNGGLNLSIRDGWWTSGSTARTAGRFPRRRRGRPTAATRSRPGRSTSSSTRRCCPGSTRSRARRSRPLGGDGSAHPPGDRPQVLATRMVRDYVQDLYVPAAGSAARWRSRATCRPARRPPGGAPAG